MKKLLILPLIALIAFFVSCSSDDDNQTPSPEPQEQQSNIYTVEGSECVVTVNNNATLTIVMKNAKFAEKMPAMNIILPNVPFYTEGDKKNLLASEIVPEVVFGGVQGSYNDYVINDFSGSVAADGSISFQGYMHLGKIAFNGAGDGVNYKGTTTVTYPDGEASVDVPSVDVTEYPNVKSDFLVEENLATITLHDVSFAPKMPKMSIRIPSLPLVEEGVYAANAIVPEMLMGGGVYVSSSAYTMSDVNCVQSGNTLQLSFTISQGHLRYNATATEGGEYQGTITISNITE